MDKSTPGSSCWRVSFVGCCVVCMFQCAAACGNIYPWVLLLACFICRLLCCMYFSALQHVETSTPGCSCWHVSFVVCCVVCMFQCAAACGNIYSWVLLLACFVCRLLCCMYVSVRCSMWKHLLLGAPAGVFHTARAVVLYACFSVLQHVETFTPGCSCWRVSYS